MIMTHSLQTPCTLQHPDCFVCSPQRPFGLHIDYRRRDGGGVEAQLDCPAAWQGYPGHVHGGVIASLVDGAMTHGLFAEGVTAVTADLRVRYRHPLRLDEPARVVAEIDRRSPPLYVLHARIVQGDRVCTTATGKFMEQRNAFHNEDAPS